MNCVVGYTPTGAVIGAMQFAGCRGVNPDYRMGVVIHDHSNRPLGASLLAQGRVLSDLTYSPDLSTVLNDPTYSPDPLS